MNWFSCIARGKAGTGRLYSQQFCRPVRRAPRGLARTLLGLHHRGPSGRQGPFGSAATGVRGKRHRLPCALLLSFGREGRGPFGLGFFGRWRPAGGERRSAVLPV